MSLTQVRPSDREEAVGPGWRAGAPGTAGGVDRQDGGGTGGRGAGGLRTEPRRFVFQRRQAMVLGAILPADAGRDIQDTTPPTARNAPHGHGHTGRRMPKREKGVPAVAVPVEEMIVTVRGERVILDHDLARLYGVTTKALNQAVRERRGQGSQACGLPGRPEEVRAGQRKFSFLPTSPRPSGRRPGGEPRGRRGHHRRRLRPTGRRLLRGARHS